MKFPEHKAGLYLTHNQHRDIYLTVEQWEADYDMADYWVSDSERALAVATDSVWELQWYPETPVGFYLVMAASLEAVLEAAEKIEREDKRR